MGLLIFLVRILAKLLHIPLELCGFLAGAVILCLAIAGVLVIKSARRELRSIIIHSLILALFCTYICKLAPYVDSRTKTVVPELVTTLDADEGNPHLVLTYYSVERWPFVISSGYKAINSNASSVDELDWVRANATAPDEFTYIISYGWEIESVSYNIWDSLDYIPAPWYGVSMSPEFVFGEFTGDIYLYRIELTQIDTVH